jgi:hypothetical protein
LNKTNTIIYYTVVEANGKRRCCGVLNPSVVFIETPAEVEKPAKVKKEKKAKAVVAEAEVEDAGADLA